MFKFLFGKSAIRRWVIGLFIVILYTLYYLLLDTNNGEIKDLSYGVDLLLSVNGILLALMGGLIVDTLSAMWFDGEDNETNIIKKSMKGCNACGMIYMGNSIRILAYGVVVGAAFIAYFGR